LDLFESSLNLTVRHLGTVRKFKEGDEFESLQVCKANARESVLYLGNKSHVYITPVRKPVCTI